MYIALIVCSVLLYLFLISYLSILLSTMPKSSKERQEAYRQRRRRLNKQYHAIQQNLNKERMRLTRMRERAWPVSLRGINVYIRMSRLGFWGNLGVWGKFVCDNQKGILREVFFSRSHSPIPKFVFWLANTKTLPLYLYLSYAISYICYGVMNVLYTFFFCLR